MTLPGNLLQRWTRWRNRWKAEAEQTYHYRHRRSLLRALDRAMRRARPVVAATYGEAFVTGALTAARQAFIALLPRVPYIRWPAQSTDLESGVLGLGAGPLSGPGSAGCVPL